MTATKRFLIILIGLIIMGLGEVLRRYAMDLPTGNQSTIIAGIAIGDMFIGLILLMSAILTHDPLSEEYKEFKKLLKDQKKEEEDYKKNLK